MPERAISQQLEAIRNRCSIASNLEFSSWVVTDLVEEDVPALLNEIDRLRSELSFIANIDLTKNALNAEHVAVSVKTWALDVLDGINHDGKSRSV